MAHRELEELFERYRERNDLAALGLVFDRTAGELLAIARRLARDEATAEDLVQATFASAIEHARRFDGKRELVPWLAGILANKAKLAQWARSREPDAARVSERVEIDPALDAELREFIAALDRALRRLPSKYADVLRRALADGQRPERIARELGLEPGTVRVRLHRGLAALRKMLPVGFALGAGVSLSPRGLSAVRAGVLSHAQSSLASGASTSVSLLGSWSVVAIAAGIAALAGAGTWALRANQEPERVSALGADVRYDRIAASSADVLAMPLVASNGARESAATQNESSELTDAAVNQAAGMKRLFGHFEGPAGNLLQPALAVVKLHGELGARYEFVTHDEVWARFDSLAPDRYALRVDAPGFLHFEQTVDLSSACSAGDSDGEAPQRFILWPDGWIPLIVRTRDGRPFRGYADDLGIDPLNLFIGAFDAVASLDVNAAGDETLARFFRPPRDEHWELPGGAFGSLELLHSPPLWVGLRLWKDPVQWAYLAPSSRQIVFTLDAEEVERRFARVTLQVVAAGTGRPALDARVALRANTAARRRQDQQDVAPASNGAIEFTHVVPGVYELSVARGAEFEQQRLELAVGEHRDLGRIELEDDSRIPVRVQDPLGNPVEAWIEIGPYRAGGSVIDLYPHALHRKTKGHGDFAMPMPLHASVVRATAMARDSGAAAPARSLNVIVDRSSPPGQLVLVVANPIEVRCEVLDSDAATYELVDELDLVVARSSLKAGAQPQFEVAPGNYRARLLSADGRVRAEKAVAVRDAAVWLWLP